MLLGPPRHQSSRLASCSRGLAWRGPPPQAMVPNRKQLERQYVLDVRYNTAESERFAPAAAVGGNSRLPDGRPQQPQQPIAGPLRVGITCASECPDTSLESRSDCNGRPMKGRFKNHILSFLYRLSIRVLAGCYDCRKSACKQATHGHSSRNQGHLLHLHH